MSSFILNLLHLSDSILPIGGFSHSNGLETYVQKEIIKTPEELKRFLISLLSSSILHNDIAFVSLIYDACQEKKWDEVCRLDMLCNASKLPKEIRVASQKLGKRLMKIFNPLVNTEITKKIEYAINDKTLIGHYSILFGIFAYELKIPKKDALMGYYYNLASGYIVNAVKLIPLSQDSGQILLFQLLPLFEKLAQEALEPNLEMLGLSSTAFDIRAMEHENLYSRLYMS